MTRALRSSAIALVLALSTALPAALTHDQAVDLFVQANEAFRKANAEPRPDLREPLYDRAILAFQRIIDEGGVANAKVHYNLANAYLLKGDIGMAILHYRRAEHLCPGDLNILKNLAFARNRRIDKVDEKTRQQVLHTLLFWHYDFSVKTRFTLACVAFACVCLGLTIVIWRGRSGGPVALVVVAACGLTCMAGSVAVTVRTEANTHGGVITADQIIARQGDGANYPASFKESLHAGTEFLVLEQRPGWLHVRLADGTDTWIQAHAAELI